MGKLEKEREADEDKAAAAGFDDAPPPGYGDDDDTPDAPPPGYTPGPSPYKKVPVGWNLYQKTWSLRTYYLGQHAKQPQFTLELHSGILMTRPFLKLFDGPDAKTSPLLATANRDATFRSHAKITVPGANGPPPVIERLLAHTRRFDFTFEITRGKETRREAFEWRFSHGKEVRALDRWAQGWKLVHLGPIDGSGQPLGHAESGGSGGSRKTRPHGETSDGLPVVAVFADNSKLSRSKLARFHFVGAGATDEFGEAWAMFVTMSALRIWELMMQASASGAAAGAAGGAAAC